ncbi:MAG: hypothetical protein ACTSX8_10465 [Alphaproteobacteria bacterium]
MNLEKLVADIDSHCDDEAASGDINRLGDLRYVLEQLASYADKRERGVKARLAGNVDDACKLETWADAQATQLGIDASAMVRPVQSRVQPTRRLPTLDDVPITDDAFCPSCREYKYDCDCDAQDECG